MSDLRITIIENGPYRVSGEVSLSDSEGQTIATREGRDFYLCRCGGSSRKPFCDGTHKKIGFAAPPVSDVT